MDVNNNAAILVEVNTKEISLLAVLTTKACLERFKKRPELRLGTGTGTGTKENSANQAVSEKLQRIAVSKEAQNALKAITDRVNDGFNGGKVGQTEMANWILLHFQSELDEVKIKEIRAVHFDEVAMLESILKQAKESGKVPTDFKALLQRQLGVDELPKRKSKGP